jgi:UDP-galactopyranose mutase
MIARYSGRTADYTIEDSKVTRPGHDAHYGLDGAKLHGLGWKSPVSLENSMASSAANFITQFHRSLHAQRHGGRDPANLPASIIKRLPLRFTYDDNVFFHKYQGMPRNGYTVAVERMLDSVEVKRGLKFTRSAANEFDHVFYTGPLDEWFRYEHGMLAYRTLDFKHSVYPDRDVMQGCSVLNNCDFTTPWTRRTEHKFFTPWDPAHGTVVTEETPREWVEGDVRYYPVRLAQDKAALAQYEERAKAEPNVSFVGRLATYRYLDMDQCIREAMDAARKFAGAAGAISVIGI